MCYRKTKTRFTKLIRIDPVVYKWLEENKNTKTNAGFLDKLLKENAIPSFNKER